MFHANAFLWLLIGNSSTPECWRTVPSEVKPVHQALCLVKVFAPPPCYAHSIERFLTINIGPGDQAKIPPTWPREEGWAFH